MVVKANRRDGASIRPYQTVLEIQKSNTPEIKKTMKSMKIEKNRESIRPLFKSLAHAEM
jgi:hypothetical protein